MDNMRQQSENCGTKIITETIDRVDFSSKPFKLFTENTSEPIFSHSVIIATGATAKRMNLPGNQGEITI